MKRFIPFTSSIKFIVQVMFFLLLLMMVYRLFFFYHYKPSNKPFSGSMMLLGLRYDLRIVAALGIVMNFLMMIPAFNFFKHKKNSTFWVGFLTLIFFVFLIAYGSDFYYYDYLKQRLSAAIVSFAQDAGISATMMWQTYPIVRILLFLLLCMWLFVWFIKKLLLKVQAQHADTTTKNKVVATIVFMLLLGLAVFGKIGQYPLRWSDAFNLSDDFKANTSLNPFQSFLSTLSFKKSGYDVKKVKEVYPTMATYLGVQQPNAEQLMFDRVHQANATITNKPNIVIVICESFSAYKSSMFGNALNATPYFNSMCQQGIFFERCFTPAFGTARGVWATVTGIPDVEDNKTASRNPAAVNQHSIMNDFEGYEKMYFLGGSTTWANIRGVLKNNIIGLQIFEEDHFKAKKVDVWGISDKNLFLEANNILAQQNKPFISIIQTADNHRPYTIPAEDQQAFKVLNYPADTLKKYGFDDNGQYNAFRYADFCFQQFIEAAKKQPYFNNTIFVFVGDHGLRGDAGNLFPQSFTKQGILAEHVPLLFYAPKLLQPQRIAAPASQLDVLPTVAHLANQQYTNTTLGVNLFDTTIQKNRVAFIADPDTRTIGVVGNDYYYAKSLNTGAIDFVSVKNNNAIVPNKITDSIKANMASLTDAFYYSSKYLLLNNKKRLQ